MTAGRREQLATALADCLVTGCNVVERLNHLEPVVERLCAEAAAEALETALREDRTTVAKLSKIEQLTCLLVKGEDLVTRAAALRAAVPSENGQ